MKNVETNTRKHSFSVNQIIFEIKVIINNGDELIS